MPKKHKYCSLNEIFNLTFKLGNRIRISGFKPKCMIGISRGGLLIVRLLSDFLDVSQIFTIGINYYHDIRKAHSKPRILQLPPKKFIEGREVLLIDDIADSGRSLSMAFDLLNSYGAVDVKTAVIHYKPWSMLEPDFYVEETERWVIYPWEIFETIRSILRKRELTADEKKKELANTGINENFIHNYFSYAKRAR